MLAERHARRVRHSGSVRLLSESRGGHPGVVHPGHGQTHHARRDGLLPDVVLPGRQPEGGARGRDGDEYGDADDGWAVGHVSRDAHRRHAGVVHGSDADAHEGAAHQDVAGTRTGARDPGEGRPGRADGDQEREQGQPHAVDHRHGHLEGQHPHEVHRPDAPAHGERRRTDPPPVCPRGRAPHASAEVQGGVGRQHRDGDGQGDEGRIVARAAHGPMTSFVAGRRHNRPASPPATEPRSVSPAASVRVWSHLRATELGPRPSRPRPSLPDAGHQSPCRALP